ncbi:MAG: C-GCAxxG-C-C family (seleno)protein [Desulfomonilia bacterium]
MKGVSEFVGSRVHCFYWNEDRNCAYTSLKIYSEWFDIPLDPQVLDASLGMHGAGEYGAQCGLVEGCLMFIGIIGKAHGMDEDEIIGSCREFAVRFEHRFGSLECRTLRPEGFRDDNPPHICEHLSSDAICFGIEFIDEVIRDFQSLHAE